MSLDKIVDAAYKAALPLRLVDKTIKLGFDAVAAASEQFGFDRYYLAKGAGFFAATGFGVAQGLDRAAYNPHVGGLYAILGVGLILVFSRVADEMRRYSSEKADVLDKRLESVLILSKLVRYTFIVTFPFLIPGTLRNLLQSQGLIDVKEVVEEVGKFASVSYCYLIDGDRAIWDKTMLKARQAYQFLKKHSLPQPQPGPAVAVYFQKT